MNTLSDEILVQIERLANPRGKLRSKKRKPETNSHYPLATHYLGNLPLTKNERESVLEYIRPYADASSNNNHRTIYIWDNQEEHDPKYLKKVILKALKSIGLKRNVKDYVRKVHSLAPTSKRLRNLPRF